MLKVSDLVGRWYVDALEENANMNVDLYRYEYISACESISRGY